MQFVYQGKLNSRSTSTLGTTSTTISIAGFYASSTVYTATATDRTLTGTANNDAFIYDFTLGGVNRLRFSGFLTFDLGAGDDFFDMTVRASNVDSPYDTNYTVYGGSGNDRLWLAGQLDTAYGDVEALTGTEARSVRGGDDIINASQFRGEEYSPGLYGDAATLTYAIGGADIILGGDDTSEFMYGDGYTLINSYGGNDTLTGAGSSDRLYGDGYELASSSNSDADNSEAYGGNDTLFGDDGDDWLYGDGAYVANNAAARANCGADLLHGGNNNDIIYGDAESLAAGTGSLAACGGDVISGDDGADLIYGDSASIGGADPSTVSQLGNDIIDGGAGDDELWGDYGWKSDSVSLLAGGGNDSFVFQPGSGQDTISDFGQQAGGPQGRDTIDLAAYGIHAFSELDITGNGTSAAIVNLGNSNTITVKAFDGAALTLTSADFTFA